jgi:hypothetical protein
MIRAAALALLLACQAHAQTVVIYARADAISATKARDLVATCSRTTLDRDMAPGVLWRPTMAAAICAADVVLLVWSARAAASQELRREIDAALACRRPIVPVLIDSTPLPGIVADTNAVDWR